MARVALVLLPLLAAAAACAPPYRMEAPPSFKRFERTADFRFITAEGVLLRAREVENYPRAELPFWTEALRRHLLERGYGLKGERKFETKAGLPAATLEFLVPHGAEDWVLSETLFVAGDRIVVLEVAGPFERYAVVEAEVAKALPTFDPGD